jgi:hypothetical protein
MNPYTFSLIYPRGKREGLRDYITRVIANDCDSDLPGGRESKIAEALDFYRDAVSQHIEQEVEGRFQSEIRRKDAQLTELGRRFIALQAQNARLQELSSGAVSVREAEEGRLRAAIGMRERAARLVEWPEGCPNDASEAIRDLPDPSPKWARA